MPITAAIASASVTTTIAVGWSIAAAVTAVICRAGIETTTNAIGARIDITRTQRAHGEHSAKKKEDLCFHSTGFDAAIP
jgi:hypothetical protein